MCKLASSIDPDSSNNNTTLRLVSSFIDEFLAKLYMDFGNDKFSRYISVANMNEEMTLQQIKVNLSRHKGDYQVLIYLPSGKTLSTDRSLWAEPSPALRNQLVALLGQENVKM